MKHIRLKPLQYYIVSSAVGLILLSGVVWMVSRAISSRSLLESDFSTPFELMMMKAHGLAAYLFMYAAGSMFWHVFEGWNAGRNRRSGSSIVLSITILMLTGWGLYYFSNQSLRETTALIHEVIGIFLGAVFIIHQRNSLKSLPSRLLRRNKATL